MALTAKPYKEQDMTNKKQEALAALDNIVKMVGEARIISIDDVEIIRAALSTIPEPVIVETPAEIENGLLPCPFCGEQAKLWRDGKVSCTNTSCGCWRSHLQDNVVPFWADSWNTRALTAQQPVRGDVTGETSDGYHTFNELYEHRHILFLAVLKAHPNKAWRSKLHADGTMFDGWFIAGLDTDLGQATYHLPIRMWHLFADIKELDNAPLWDGHTSNDVLVRIRDMAYFKPLAATPAEAPKVDVKNKFNIGDIVNVREGYKFSEWEKEDLIITAVRWDRKKDTILYDGAVVGEPLHYGDTTDFEESDLVKKSEG